MLILAFDTSGTAGSVAVLDGGRVLAERELDAARRSAQTLAPAIHEALLQAGVEPPAIRLVATTIGPGSFTGLRIGVTTAKTFAYAIGAQVIGLSTLEVIAAQAPLDLIGERREVHAVLDAQRGELFVGRFQLSQPAESSDLPKIERLDADRVLTPDRWNDELPVGAIVAGSGLRKLRGQAAAATVVPEAHWQPRAVAIGRLALRAYTAGQRDDLWKLAPVYLRPSYAEEKAALKSKSAGTKPD